MPEEEIKTPENEQEIEETSNAAGTAGSEEPEIRNPVRGEAVQQTLFTQPPKAEVDEQMLAEMNEEDRNKYLSRIIEAALFMSPGPMSVRDLASLAKTTVQLARVLINELMHDYMDRETALEIFDEENGIRMGVRKDYEDKVIHLASSPEFHKGIMKTLAYIAYKQPIKQSDVIRFRNVKGYDHIHLLEEKGFIDREKKGSTFIIRTTKKFFDYFGKDIIKQQKLEVNAKKMAQLRGIKAEKQAQRDNALKEIREAHNE
jgi:segregation and condensation protein B